MMLTMMMGGDGGHRSGPTSDVPPWSSLFEEPTSGIGYHSPSAVGRGIGGGEFPQEDASALLALHRRLQSSSVGAGAEEDAEDPDAAVDLYSSDEFRMYEFKVRRCARGRSHDWTECPFAHPGEKARRRDPRKYHYSGTACPDFRKGGCKRGDACEFAHGVFECWLHPARYRTQPCKDGTACRRRVCFFAHTPDQLRVLSAQQQHLLTKASATVDSYDGSPMRQQALESYISKHLVTSSPTSTLMSPPMSPPSDSPPVSPSTAALRRASWPVGASMNDVVASLRQLQLSKAKSLPSSWGIQLGNGLFGSPRGATPPFRAGFCSLPTTPTTTGMGGSGVAWFDGVEGGLPEEEEPMERVESGRALRAKLFEKLSKECVAERGGGAAPSISAPDIGWVSELVK
ncbi:zinc finger CCCH domain-containing protein 2-like [Canna indica]|uniref:Zinc finger CCCH domain-containing protein 2-like n=1 Tax=Canna indica TaxID=4628 RepID=A0AAQ3JVQ1_9LILI|nr:zinc finger CCCH domain-containing protein 2-like [Canna indica]